MYIGGGEYGRREARSAEGVLCAFNVCLICMPDMYALYVCLICMPYMYIGGGEYADGRQEAGSAEGVLEW